MDEAWCGPASWEAPPKSEPNRSAPANRSAWPHAKVTPAYAGVSGQETTTVISHPGHTSSHLLYYWSDCEDDYSEGGLGAGPGDESEKRAGSSCSRSSTIRAFRPASESDISGSRCAPPVAGRDSLPQAVSTVGQMSLLFKQRADQGMDTSALYGRPLTVVTTAQAQTEEAAASEEPCAEPQVLACCAAGVPSRAGLLRTPRHAQGTMLPSPLTARAASPLPQSWQTGPGTPDILGCLWSALQRAWNSPGALVEAWQLLEALETMAVLRSSSSCSNELLLRMPELWAATEHWLLLCRDGLQPKARPTAY